MGAINFGKSKYITLGTPDYTHNENALPKQDEEEEYGYYTDIYNILKEELDETFPGPEGQDPYYFTIEIKDGYYNGYWIDIDESNNYYFADIEDMNAVVPEIREEINKIIKFFKDMVYAGILCVVNPTWTGNGDEDIDSSIKDIDKAKEEMLKELNDYIAFFKQQNDVDAVNSSTKVTATSNINVSNSIETTKAYKYLKNTLINIAYSNIETDAENGYIDFDKGFLHNFSTEVSNIINNWADTTLHSSIEKYLTDHEDEILDNANVNSIYDAINIL